MRPRLHSALVDLVVSHGRCMGVLRMRDTLIFFWVPVFCPSITETETSGRSGRAYMLGG